MHNEWGKAERGLGKMTCTMSGLGIPLPLVSFSPAHFSRGFLGAQKAPAGRGERHSEARKNLIIPRSFLRGQVPRE
jgi:hypothetical protein